MFMVGWNNLNEDTVIKVGFDVIVGGYMVERFFFFREFYDKKRYFSNINIIVICKIDQRGENKKKDNIIILDLKLEVSKEKC